MRNRYQWIYLSVSSPDEYYVLCGFKLKEKICFSYHEILTYGVLAVETLHDNQLYKYNRDRSSWNDIYSLILNPP